MTTPVTTYVESKEGKEQTKYTMGFLIAEEHQDNPPDPADPNIFIENRAEMRVVTRRFGGFTSEANVQKEVKDLTEILKGAGEEGVHYSEYYIAGYDPPYKLINRRNEIWFVKTPSEGVTKAPEGEEVVS
ncbi:UNVERIFIED_CONTAM: hypothetical protein GTU68_064882 [Idotea baltica]|nr:hypothetical protein [Idotea baltica]